MIKVDIFSGFLGAGKTTLIKKLIEEAYKGEKLVLIENEFGEIGIDGGFLKDAGVEINEMNSGCICCSLVGDFGKALEQVIDTYQPERILIEPSGVGKLSDIISAVENLELDNVQLNGFTTVVDAKKAKIYMKNFGEFFNNQVEHASSIILSHTAGMDDAKLARAVELLREHNAHATIIATDWDKLTGGQILDAMENKDTIEEALHLLEEEHHHHHHEHHEHDHGEECTCGCGCGHDHHGHHHADEVFDSIGMETTKKYTIEKIQKALDVLDDDETYGMILRAKGIVEAEDGSWIHFDYVPGEPDVRTGAAGIIGRLCVIGAGVNQEEIHKLFEI